MSVRKRNEIKRKAFPFIIIGAILAVVLIVGVFIRIEPQNTGNQIETQSEGVADSQIASTQIKADNLSCKIPTGWGEVKQELQGDAKMSKSFIHSASNSGIYIDKYDYKPEVNYMLFNGSSFVPQNSQLTDYKTNNQNEGTIYYETPSNAGTYYCGQKYIWDKDEVYLITVNINSLYYDRLSDVMDFVFDSVEHEAKNPIAPDTYINYASEYDCEYGLPLDWQEENGMLTDGTNNLSVITMSKDVDLSTYNSLNFNTDFNIQDGIITSVKYEDGRVVADGEISNDGGKIKAYLVAPEKNGNKYLIGFIWRYTDEKIEGTAKDCIKQYRTFKNDASLDSVEKIPEKATEENQKESP